MFLYISITIVHDFALTDIGKRSDLQKIWFLNSCHPLISLHVAAILKI